MLGRVVFWANNETFTFRCTSVYDLENVNQLLLILQSPYHLVIVSCAEVDHDVSVAEEKHDSARVIQLVHCTEVGYLLNVYDVEDGKVLDSFCTLDKHFIHLHAG